MQYRTNTFSINLRTKVHVDCFTCFYDTIYYIYFIFSRSERSCTQVKVSNFLYRAEPLIFEKHLPHWHGYDLYLDETGKIEDGGVDDDAVKVWRPGGNEERKKSSRGP